MTTTDLTQYIIDNKTAILKMAMDYLTEEDGVRFEFNEVECIVYYDDWDESGKKYYIIAASTNTEDMVDLLEIAEIKIS